MRRTPQVASTLARLETALTNQLLADRLQDYLACMLRSALQPLIAKEGFSAGAIGDEERTAHD